MKALIDYEHGLADNIEKLQRLLTNQQYIEALACMDERLALISELTQLARQQTVISADMAALADNQLAQEQVLRFHVERLKDDVMVQLAAINKTHKLQSVYGDNA